MFVMDPETYEVSDPVRGIALIKNSGGSDGSSEYALVQGDFQTIFGVYEQVRDADSKEKEVHPDKATTVVYKVYRTGPPLPGLTQLQTREVISEALLAKKLPRHEEANWFVAF